MFGRKKRQVGAAASAPDITDELAVVDAVLRRYPPGATLHFGAPTRCPGCAGYGMVEGLAGGRCTNRCPACGTTWELTHRAVRAHARTVPAAAPPVTGPPPPLRLTSPAADRPAGASEAGQPGERRDRAGADAEPAPAPTPVPTAAAPAPPDDGRLRVLVVDDDVFDAREVAALLAPVGEAVVLHHAVTRDEGERLARRHPLHVVLLDLGLPDSTGFDTLIAWQRAVPSSVAVVAVLDDQDELLVRQLRAMGVTTVVFRSHLRNLLGAPTGGATRLLRVLATAADRPVPEVPTLAEGSTVPDAPGPDADLGGDGWTAAGVA